MSNLAAETFIHISSKEGDVNACFESPQNHKDKPSAKFIQSPSDFVKAPKKLPRKRKRGADDDEIDNQKIDLKTQENKAIGRLSRAITWEKSKANLIGKNERPLLSKINMRKRLKAAEKDSGALAGLVDGPLDIWYLIVEELDPLDLLTLSRVSRQFRRFMMSKDNRHLWVLVRRRFGGMPDCPDDLNEAQYISLVFESFCQACGALRVRKVSINLRVRFCEGCFKKNCPRGHLLIREKFGRKVEKIKQIYSLLSYSSENYLKEGDERKTPIYSSYDHYYAPDLLDVTQKYLSLKPDSKKMQDFLEEQWRKRRAVVDHANELGYWLDWYNSRLRKDEWIRH